MMSKSGRDYFTEITSGKRTGDSLSDFQRIKVLNHLYEIEYQKAQSVHGKDLPPANGITDRRKRYAAEQVKKICTEYGIDSTGIETAPSRVIDGVLYGSGVK